MVSVKRERMRWARQTIVVTTTHGPQQVEADTYGGWAVHEPIQSTALAIAWAVTHVPTGLLVGNGFPKDQAKKLCQQLHRIVGDHPITEQGMPGIPSEMRHQIHQAVLVASGVIEAQQQPARPAGGAK